MSVMRFRYHNLVDDGTVYRYSSQIDTLPASNVQNGIKGKIWRTESGFVISTANNSVPFRDTATGSVKNVPIASGTYAATTLAAAIQTGLNTVGNYTGHTVAYSAGKFTLDSGRTSTGLFELNFDDAAYSDKTIAAILGFDHDVVQSGSVSYLGAATLGNEHQIILSLTSTSTVTCFVVDGHNLSSTAVMRLRGALTASAFNNGWWAQSNTITLTSTMTVVAGVMVKEISSSVFKAFQLHWYDRDKAFSEIGRIWAGTYFEPTYQQSNVISWDRKRSNERSKTMVSVAGGTFFDKRDPLKEYTFDSQPLNQYFDALTKTGYEDMLDEVGNDTPFYITFEAGDPANTTVYGYFVGSYEFVRQVNTPTLMIRNIVFREQK